MSLEYITNKEFEQKFNVKLDDLISMTFKYEPGEVRNNCVLTGIYGPYSTEFHIKTKDKSKISGRIIPMPHWSPPQERWNIEYSDYRPDFIYSRVESLVVLMSREEYAAKAIVPKFWKKAAEQFLLQAEQGFVYDCI
jgi:hypothetical protein